jgi:hypothetical protein
MLDRRKIVTDPSEADARGFGRLASPVAERSAP